MPFPLAHPAAVLPLRRWSPYYLNFAALVVGAVVPDLSYCLERYDLDLLAHTVRGCLLFSLPVGWILLWIFYGVCPPLVNLLPAPHRQALLASCRRKDRAWFADPLSLWIGALTHVFWDSFTHETGWFVERSSFLQMRVFTLGGHSFEMYRLLWHLSTGVGLLLIYRTYRAVLGRSPGMENGLAATERRRYVLWLGLLLPPLIPAEVIAFNLCGNDALSLGGLARLLRLSAAGYLVLVTLLLVVIGASLKLSRRSSDWPVGGQDKGVIS